jgi:predicted cupin superfamily sugar epimerase
MNVQEIVEKLNLLPHPEGGFYKETYRSEGQISQGSLNENFSGKRSYCTAIYFLLTKDNFSAFHKIKQDEMWHFYAGSPLTVHMIDKEGNYSKQLIGNNFSKNELPQFVVPKDSWFASCVEDGKEYALVGCTVSPGFDFDDFELANRDLLVKKYPNHKNIITKLTRA